MVVLWLLQEAANVHEGVVYISKSMYIFLGSLFGLMSLLIAFFVVDKFRQLKDEKNSVIKQFEKLEASMIKSIENLTTATQSLTGAINDVRLWVSDQFLSRSDHRDSLDDVYTEIQRIRETCKEDIGAHTANVRLIIEQFGKDLESHIRYCPGRHGSKPIGNTTFRLSEDGD